MNQDVCVVCGRPIAFDAIADPESDVEYPDYVHIGCLKGLYDENRLSPEEREGKRTTQRGLFDL